MLPGLVVVFHVLSVFWLVAGVIGRAACYGRARRSQDLNTLRTLTGMGSFFELGMVRPATFAVLLTGLLAAWLRGWPILGFLQGGGVNWVLVSLVIYLSIAPIILFIFLPRARAYHAALEEATAAGQITARLRAALADPLVAVGRGYEIGMAVTLAYLMIQKPF
jgi:Predicted integral membrane protein (DUF2269)